MPTGFFDRKIQEARWWAAGNLAAHLLAGVWTPEGIAGEIESVLGPVPHRTRRALAVRAVAINGGAYPPTHRRLTSHLFQSAFFRPKPGRTVATVLDAPRFSPAAAFGGLAIPALATSGELAAWLDLAPGELDWMAGERGGHGRVSGTPLQHYRYAFVGKPGGTSRLIEAPKPRLKAIQRRILHEILAAVPVHACAKGFVAGRSCLDGAQVHAGEDVVVTLDLAQFFPSIGLPRIYGLFRRLGYPWAVARCLAGLCTTMTPAGVAGGLPDAAQTVYRVAHLPQGAPTSPALANLLAWTLDVRLHGLARAAGANYTRYADDLAFSGDARFAGGVDRFCRTAGGIVVEEGFCLNVAKTRVMPRSTRQRVTGIVVNAHCNVGRAGFDALKAVLYNCARHGPAGQNRAGVGDFRRHLDGRVCWVEQVNPRRGAKLRGMFERIVWGVASLGAGSGTGGSQLR